MTCLFRYCKLDDNTKMAQTFRFFSQDEKIAELLESSPQNYKVVAFHFEMITPASGHIMKRNLSDINKDDPWIPVRFEGFYPVKRGLTDLVIKYSPKWYGTYMDVLPIKVTRLEFELL